MPNYQENEPLSSALWGLFAIAGAAALWAIAASVASDLFDAGIDPLELAQARSYIALVGLSLVALVRRRAARRHDGGSRSIGTLLALGVSIAAVNLVYYEAIDRLAIAVAIVLQYTAPALVVAYAALRLRRRPGTDILIALSAALVGVVLVSELPRGDVAGVDPIGLAAGVASALFFAGYSVLSERAGLSYPPVGVMLRAFAVATVIWVIVQLPNGLPSTLWSDGNAPGVVFVGLVGTLAPFLLYAWGVNRVRAERATIAATLEPVLAALVAWAWLGQTLSLMQLVGGILVIVGVAFLQTKRPEGEPASPPPAEQVDDRSAERI